MVIFLINAFDDLAIVFIFDSKVFISILQLGSRFRLVGMVLL